MSKEFYPMAFETQLEAAATSARSENSAVLATSNRDGLRALIGLAGVVAVFQIVQGLNADTSWLLTVGDRWLGGARLYRDILETNPPMSVLMFMPGLLLARISGIAAEPIIIVGIAALALGSIEWTVRTFVAGNACASPARTRLVLGFACLILPMSTFAEREHVAVIVLLPIWAVMVIRTERQPIGRWAMLVAGLGAGFAMCIKPQFAAAILLPALVVARANRRFAALFQIEYCIAGAVVLIYAAVVLMVFPAYISDMLPRVVDLYRPVREPIEVILSAQVMPWIGLSLAGLWLMAGSDVRQSRFAIPLLAGLGFMLAVIEQSKGWAYHYYPVVAAITPALLDAGFAVANTRIADTTKGARLVIVAGFLAVAAGMMFATLSFLGVQRPMQSLVAPIARLAAHPKMIAISSHLWVGHPLVRDIGGTWVGSVPNELMTLGALYKLGKHPPDESERQRLEEAIARDRALLAADIARGKPDIVLVEHDDRVFPAWFGSDAELVTFLAGYSLSSVEMGVVDIWVRNR